MLEFSRSGASRVGPERTKSIREEAPLPFWNSGLSEEGRVGFDLPIKVGTVSAIKMPGSYFEEPGVQGLSWNPLVLNIHVTFC